MTTKRIFLPAGLLAMTLAYGILPVQAQAERDGESRVEFVSCWPSAIKQNDKRLSSLFSRVILGTKPPVLSNPVSILAEGPEDFLVTDQGNRTVLNVKKGVGEMPHPLKRCNLDFTSLVGITKGPGNEVLFTDSHAGKVYFLSEGMKEIGVLGDSLSLEQPTGIAWSPSRKEIWVVETRAHRLAVLSETGQRLRTVGERGNGPGQFNFPTHLWIDRDGLVYVVDAMNFRIQILDGTGSVLSVFGQAGDATGYIARPKGVATDSHGHIYVVDALFHAVQVFDRLGTFLYKFGSQGRAEGEFWLPGGIYIDKKDQIYIADSYNSRIQVFRLIYQEKQ